MSPNPSPPFQINEATKPDSETPILAIYHYQLKPMSRSAGRSATASAAYRSGEKLHDLRTGQTYDYSKRSGVMLSAVILPDGGSANREQLWNAVEQAEKRVNSVVAREIVVALPHELSSEQQQALVKDYAQGLSARTGWGVDVAIHAPGREGDLRNVHAHLLCTTRNVSRDPSGLPVMNQKTREWDIRSSGSELIRSERSEWERCVNVSLEQAQVQSRVDCRSHAERGTGLEPQIHLGVAAMGMERKGIQTQRGDIHRGIAAHNAKIIDLGQVRESQAEEKAFQTHLDEMLVMSFAELKTARTAYKPKSAIDLVEEDARVRAEKERLDSFKAEQSRLHDTFLRVSEAQVDINGQERLFREYYPWQARLYDLHLVPHEVLSGLAEQREARRVEKIELEAALVVSRIANMNSMNALVHLRGDALPDALVEHGRQLERFREVEAIYQPQKQEREAEARLLLVRQQEAERQRWEKMSVKELEVQEKHFSVNDPRSIAFEYSAVQAAVYPLRDPSYAKPSGQYHQKREEWLKREEQSVEQSLAYAKRQANGWDKAHPVKAVLYEQGFPIRERDALEKKVVEQALALKQAEKVLGVFRFERAKAQEKLKTEIEKVMPQAEKEAMYRKERLIALNRVLKPKQALEQEKQREQQREQDRKREQERGRDGGRGMER